MNVRPDATMTVKRDRTRRAAGAGLLARLRRPALAWIAALALVLQIGFSAAHAPASASSAELAAAALSTAIGQQVSLCAERGGDHSGAPGHAFPCCDDCALCGACSPLAPSQSLAALFAPERPAVGAFAPRGEAEALPPTFFSAARSRAPPLPV
jgi:hypothetical protein